MKIPAKIFVSAWLSILMIQFAWFFVLLPGSALAADDIKFTPQVGIPGAGDKFGPGSTYTFDKKSTQPIAEYIQSIYKYAIAIVGILATMTMMLGGVMWIVSGGSAERAGEAKAWISASLTGLLLTILSYLILATVNPALTNFKISSIPNVTDLGCCLSWLDGSKTNAKCDATTSSQCEKGRGDYYAMSCSGVFYCTARTSCKLDEDNGILCIASDGKQGYCVYGSSHCNPCKTAGATCGATKDYECCSGSCNFGLVGNPTGFSCAQTKTGGAGGEW